MGIGGVERGREGETVKQEKFKVTASVGYWLMQPSDSQVTSILQRGSCQPQRAAVSSVGGGGLAFTAQHSHRAHKPPRSRSTLPRRRLWNAQLNPPRSGFETFRRGRTIWRTRFREPGRSTVSHFWRDLLSIARRLKLRLY